MITRIGRLLSVWLLVTAALAGGWAAVGNVATMLLVPSAWRGTFEDLLVAIAAATLVACLGWLWVITTATVAGLLNGRSCEARGLTRHLVLMACGIAVVAGVSGPALASSGSGETTLAGLPLPDRAVADAPKEPWTGRSQAQARDQAQARSTNDLGDLITVRAGDSLWSIARAELGPGAGDREIDTRWRALYAANRSEIGPDPDLVRPGQRLRPPDLPAQNPRTHTP